jgi:hypothetical protein
MLATSHLAKCWPPVNLHLLAHAPPLPCLPCKLATTLLLCMFDTHTLPSCAPVITTEPSWCTPRHVMPSWWKGCPCNVKLHSPDLGFHTRRLQSLSPPTDMTCLPSGVKAPAVTGPLWPENTCRGYMEGEQPCRKLGD